MMTLDEAIKHAEEVIDEKKKEACNLYDTKNYEESRECIWCAEEHKQLSEWLKDYKRLLEQEPTRMVDKSNFSQEQYKADLQSAYDCGKSILDKIKAEIKDWQKDIHDNEQDAEKYDFVFESIYESIDKCKAESEG